MDREYLQLLNLNLRWIYFLTFFGLCTIKEVGRSENKVRYVTSILKAGFSIFHMILFACLWYIQIIYSNKSCYAFEGPNYLNEYLSLCGFPISILILLTELANIKKSGTFFTNTINFERAFGKSTGSAITQRVKKFFILLFITISFSLACDCAQIQKGNWDFEFILNMIPGYVLVIYTLISVVQFSSLQFWLQKLFIQLNEDLVHFCKLSSEYDSSDISEVITISFAIYRDNKDISLKKQQDNCKFILQKLRKVRLMYKTICKISREMDNLFSYRNLIIVAAALANSVILLFFLMICAYRYARNPETYYGIQVVSALRGALLNLSMIWGLVWSCESTCNEAKKSALIIQDYIINVTDPKIKTELKDFATQILYEKVYFSPNGFFVLENRMLLSILSAIASYIIILLQFYPVFGAYPKK